MLGERLRASLQRDIEEGLGVPVHCLVVIPGGEGGQGICLLASGGGMLTDERHELSKKGIYVGPPRMSDAEGIYQSFIYMSEVPEPVDGEMVWAAAGTV